MTVNGAGIRLSRWVAVAGVIGLCMGGAACQRDRPQGKALAPLPAGSGPALDGAGPSPADDASTEPATFSFSQANSKITFVATEGKAKREIILREFTGAIVMVGRSVATASVTAELDMTSLDAGDPKLTDLLKSGHFLGVEKYPRATFVSTAVNLGGEGGETNTVMGTLQLRGKNRTAAVPATIHVQTNDVAVDAAVDVDLKALGLTYPGKPRARFGNEVRLNLYIQATRAR